MNGRPPPVEPAAWWRSRWRRWLIPAALGALTPKCFLCLLAYAGLGAALELGGPELCGATGAATGHWVAWLPALGAVAAGMFILKSR